MFGGDSAEQTLQENGADQGLPVVPASAQSVNTTGAQPYTAAQLSLLSQLQGEANGTSGPSAAQANLQSGLGQTLAASKAAAAGARGNNQNVGLANQQIGNQAASANSATAGQAAALRAQEQANAQGQEGNLALSGAQQQEQVAEANANLANSQYQTQAENTMAQNQAAATLAGAQEAQNSSFGAGLVGDIFGQFKAPALAEGGVVDPDWESHVTPIAGPGVNTFSVSSGANGGSGVAAIQTPASPFSGSSSGGKYKPPKGGSDESKPASFTDNSGGFPNTGGGSDADASTSADNLGATDLDAGGDVMAAADGGVVDGAEDDSDPNDDNPVPNTTDFGGSSPGNLLSLFMATGGVVSGRDPASLKQFPASRPEPGRDPNSLAQYPEHVMRPGSMDLSQPNYVSVTQGNTTTGIPAAANGAVLKGPRVVLAGEAGPEAFVPLKKDGSMLPDESKAKGPGMAKFIAALKANGFKSDSEDNNPNNQADKAPITIHHVIKAGAALEQKVDGLHKALSHLAKKKGVKGKK